jgi:hypothetical protein
LNQNNLNFHQQPCETWQLRFEFKY